MKFALISHTLPPSPSGQAMIIHRLLKDLDPDAYSLIISGSYNESDTGNGFTPKLPGKIIRQPREFRLTRGYRYGLSKFRESINFALGILLRGRQIARSVKQENCRAIVACTGGYDLLDLPAAYVASRIAGVPFYPYYFDDYYYQWAGVASWTAVDFRPFVRRLESILIRGAKGVIVPNEFMGQELQLRYGVSSTVIRNACDPSAYETSLPGELPKNDGVIRIVYTGAVYDAHYDSFVNLVEALRLLDRRDVELHIYTSHPQAELVTKGVRGPVFYHDHIAQADVAAIQRQADILFLPLAFNSPYPELIRTSAPVKVAEYLFAGRPILVHAPPDSFIAEYFRRYQCGVVVDRSDAFILAQSLDRLLSDTDLRRSVCAQALERAREDFDIRTARAKFLKLLAVEQ